jgi:phosphoenolpyruvate carboxylase-like protein
MLRCEILKPGLPCTGVQISALSVVLTRGNVTLPGMNIRGGSTTVPSAGYADLPPGIGLEPKDEPLRRDINLLGRVLGRILIEQEGEILFETEEEVRLLCKRLRFDYDPELDERLRRRIEAMSVEELRRLVRAFSVYFLLVNIAERYHRVRRRQYESAPDNPPQRASVASALARLKGEGLGQEALRRVLDGMAVGPARYDRPSDGGHEAERQAQAREDRGDARGYGVARSNVEGAKASGGGRSGPQLDRCCGRRGWQMRRRAPRSSRSHHAPRHALLRPISEVGRLSDNSPQSMGVRARRSRWLRVPMTSDPVCRASFVFLILLLMP